MYDHKWQDLQNGHNDYDRPNPEASSKQADTYSGHERAYYEKAKRNSSTPYLLPRQLRTEIADGGTWNERKYCADNANDKACSAHDAR